MPIPKAPGGLERQLSSKEHLLFLQRDWVQFPISQLSLGTYIHAAKMLIHTSLRKKKRKREREREREREKDRQTDRQAGRQAGRLALGMDAGWAELFWMWVI